ncbi:MAG: hypothetical protein ACPGYT_06950 [Nitrospirales bacterium]
MIAQDSFALVVNKQNSHTASREDMISLIARLYLKKGKMWPDSDVTCRPFDRMTNSPEHQYFMKSVLKMEEGRLSEHWAKMKQLRGDTPPRKIKSTRILLKLIEKNSGAFGIVKREDIATLPEKIKVLFLF